MMQMLMLTWSRVDLDMSQCSRQRLGEEKRVVKRAKNEVNLYL
jgi:hypothetical protein